MRRVNSSSRLIDQSSEKSASATLRRSQSEHFLPALGWSRPETKAERFELFNQYRPLHIIHWMLFDHLNQTMQEIKALQEKIKVGQDKITTKELNVKQETLDKKRKQAQRTANALVITLEKLIYISRFHFQNEYQARRFTTTKTRINALIDIGFKSESPSPIEEEPANPGYSFGFSHFFRSQFVEANWWRLFLIRLKRAVDTIQPLIKSTETGKELAKLSRLNPAIAQLAWIFYVPRFVMNLTLLLAQSPMPWMNKEDYDLQMQRFSNEWSERWFELLNDGVWLTVGLVNCFLLAGLPALGLTSGLYLFDVIMAAIKYRVEMQKYQLVAQSVQERIKAQKEQPSFDEANPDAEYIHLQELQEQLEKKSAQQSKLLTLSVVTAGALFSSMMLAFLATAFACPPVGLLAASLVIITCALSKFVAEPVIKNEKSLLMATVTALTMCVGGILIAATLFGTLAFLPISAPALIGIGIALIVVAAIVSSLANQSADKQLSDKKEADLDAQIDEWTANLQAAEPSQTTASGARQFFMFSATVPASDDDEDRPSDTPSPTS